MFGGVLVLAFGVTAAPFPVSRQLPGQPRLTVPVVPVTGRQSAAA